MTLMGLVGVVGIVVSACGSTPAPTSAVRGASSGPTALASTSPAASSSAPLKIAIVVGVTGGQAPSSANWIPGVQMAMAEINASGGILGHQLTSFTLDTQSDPAKSVAAMRDALSQNPFAVMGTILSGATIVNMSVVQAAGVPQFTGSVSPDITSKHQPTTLFFTEPNSNMEADMFTSYLVNQLHAKKVAFVYANDEFGVSGEQSFASRAKKAGVDVVAEVATQVGQVDFSGVVAKIQQAHPDTVFLYMHETETARFLKQAQSANLNKTVTMVGASSALAASTIQAAGSAANGLQGFVPYSATAPSMTALAHKFEAAHPGVVPDHNFFKGYVAMWALAYAAKQVGSLNQKAIIDYLHNRTMCVSKFPNLLESTYWNSLGNIDRTTFVVSVQDGVQKYVASIPPLDTAKFAQCGG